MDQLFYESISKEKINNLMKEGMTSQAFYRSGAPKPGLLSDLPKLLLGLLGVLAILGLLVR